MSSKVKLSSTHNISFSNIVDTDRFVVLAKDGATSYSNRLLSVGDVKAIAISALGATLSSSIYISSSGQNVTLGDIQAGDLRVGDINANSGYFRSLFIETSSIVLTTSGSTIFGNTLDDTHQFTGSIYVTGSGFTWNGYTVVTSNDTGSLAATSSYSFTSSTATYAFHADQADIALTALDAVLASTASYIDWSNIDNIPPIEATASFAFSASNAVNAFHADQADIALTALNANTASYLDYSNLANIPTSSGELIYTDYYFVTSSTVTFDLSYSPVAFDQVRIQPEGAGEMVNSQSLNTTLGNVTLMNVTPDFRITGTKTIQISGSGLSGLLYGDNELLIVTYPYII